MPAASCPITIGGMRRPERAIVPMHIAAADAARGHANQHFVGPRLWARKVGDFELKILFEKKGFHDRSGGRRFARANIDCTTARGADGEAPSTDELLAV